MAARTSSSAGMLVTVCILGVATLGLFVTSVVALNKYQGSQRELENVNQDIADYITANERRQDNVQVLVDAARRQRQSLVGYLSEGHATTMQRVTGRRSDTVERFIEQLDGVDGAETSSLLQVIRDRNSQIAGLQSQLEEANAARQQAVADLRANGERVRSLEETHRATVAALNDQIGQYRQEIESYRQGTDAVKSDMEQRVSNIRLAADEDVSRLTMQIGDLERDLAIAEDQLRLCRGEDQNRFAPEDEFALVDGSVIGISAGDSNVTIDRGRRHRVVLGMTFAVYDQPSELVPDPQTGEYPRGKGVLEVISVGEGSSTCRVVVEVQGNPVVRGDVIANPVYDPSKEYKFLVIGNFDTNRNGEATPREQSDVLAMISSIEGNIIADDLTGDLDFLVLGQRPVLPPEPNINTPEPLVREYLRLSQARQQYDDLFQRAQATSIPIINENRLYTLLGKSVAPSR